MTHGIARDETKPIEGTTNSKGNVGVGAIVSIHNLPVDRRESHDAGTRDCPLWLGVSCSFERINI